MQLLSPNSHCQRPGYTSYPHQILIIPKGDRQKMPSYLHQTSNQLFSWSKEKLVDADIVKGCIKGCTSVELKEISSIPTTSFIC